LSRTSEMDEYFHLLEAGATNIIPEEREASLLMGTHLLTECLGYEAPLVGKLIQDLRIDIDLETQDTWATIMAKKAGGVIPFNQKSDRVNEPDRQSIISSFTRGSESLNILLEDATRRFKNIIDGPRSWETDDDIFPGTAQQQRADNGTATATVTAIETVGVSADAGEEQLGVTVCYLPPKKSS